MNKLLLMVVLLFVVSSMMAFKLKFTNQQFGNGAFPNAGNFGLLNSLRPNSSFTESSLNETVELPTPNSSRSSYLPNNTFSTIGTGFSALRSSEEFMNYLNQNSNLTTNGTASNQTLPSIFDSFGRLNELQQANNSSRTIDSFHGNFQNPQQTESPFRDGNRLAMSG